MAANHDPHDLRAQERDAAERVRLEQIAQLTKADDIKWLMADVRGRRLMWDLLDKAGLYRTTMTGNSHTFFNEGMRNFGLYLIAQVNEHCPEQYPVMVKEAKQPIRTPK